MVIAGRMPSLPLEFVSGTTDLKRAVALFREKFPTAIIEAIDDREVVGTCEGCGLPVFVGDSYLRDEDGVRWHAKCPS
jgi:hypothetical protein